MAISIFPIEIIEIMYSTKDGCFRNDKRKKIEKVVIIIKNSFTQCKKQVLKNKFNL